MKLLEIQGSTAQERREWLKSVLSKAQCEITFTKVDGTVRVMPCTLRSDLLPEAPILENSRRVRNQDEVLSVWCTDKHEWRSFRVMNVTEVKEN